MDGLRRQNKRCFGVSGFKKIVKAGHVLLKVLSEKNKMIKQLLRKIRRVFRLNG